ncbi:MAG: pimeloyl-ACP methyl ester carboxylesterase [Flavobacteriales bacterium]|jgi:pimeloyl-ACP methyl ester carboxylesterase
MENILNLSVLGHDVRAMHIPNTGKPVMVFLMGSLQDIEGVGQFSDGFSPYFDYWAVELPGFGKTQPLHSKFGVPFIAECLAVFVEEYVGSSFNLVACSYATAIALDYAKLHQNRLENMVLVGSMMDIPLSHWPTMLQLLRDVSFDPPKFASGFVDLLTVDHPDIPRQAAIRRAATRRAKVDGENLWHFVFNTIRLMSFNVGDLSGITVPTLVYTGEHDPYVTPDDAKKLAQALPNAEFQILPGCDHLFFLEKPLESIAMVNQFLARRTEMVAA